MSNLAPLDSLKKTLSMPAMKEQFKAALPPHIDPDKFIRVVMTAVSTNKDLVDADRNSFFSACMKSAADGLIPDGREAALTTFKDSKSGMKIVTYMPMVAGILKKVRNSGELSSITSQIVYAKDEFSYFVDSDGEHISHKPNLFEDRGEPLGVYALAKTKDGGIYIEVLTTQQVAAIRKASKAGAGFSPWSGDFVHEMWRKSAIRRLSKRLPMSTDIDHTLHADDELFMPEQTVTETVPHEVNPEPEAKPKRESKLKQAMKQATTEPVQPNENIQQPVQTLDSEPVSDEAIPI